MSNAGITWYYVAPDTKILRHGHIYPGVSDHVQWHPASTRHPSNPAAHTEAQSWDPDRAVQFWSRKYGQDFTAAEKRAMVLRAQAEHDRTRYTPPPTPPAEPEPVEEPEPENEVTPIETETPPPSTSDDATPDDSSNDDIIEMLVALPTKVDELSGRVGKAETNLAEQRQQLRQRGSEIAALNVNHAALANDVAGLRTATTSAIGDLKQQLTVIENRTPRQLEITVHHDGTAYTAPPGTYHQKFQTMLDVIGYNDPEDRNVWLVGPAGSSKTRSVREMAKVLNLPCYIQPSVMRAHELLGFHNVSRYQTTWFREAYEKGGVCLLDEVDRSDARALVVLNGALSGDEISFPDKVVKRHPNFICAAAANTYGQGADQQYIGAMKQDAAFLDRFLFVEWPYDEAFERAISGHLDWVEVVQAVRGMAFQHRAKMVISPRASIRGSNMLNRGAPPSLVVETIFGQYLKNNLWPTIGAAAIEFAKKPAAVKHPTQPVPTPPPAPTTNGVLRHMDFSGARVFGS